MERHIGYASCPGWVLGTLPPLESPCTETVGNRLAKAHNQQSIISRRKWQQKPTKQAQNPLCSLP